MNKKISASNQSRYFQKYALKSYFLLEVVDGFLEEVVLLFLLEEQEEDLLLQEDLLQFVP